MAEDRCGNTDAARETLRQARTLLLQVKPVGALPIFASSAAAVVAQVAAREAEALMGGSSGAPAPSTRPAAATSPSTTP